LIEVQNLSVRFGDFTAVRDVSFSVAAGEVFGFLGANGAGKTTTIRVLCGLLPPSAGHVAIDGYGYEQGVDRIKAKVGYMSQKFTLYDDLTVEENLDFVASLRKLPRARYRARRGELLDFIVFRRPLNTLVRDLPGGIKQQVSLAAAVLHDPEIVFLDEPTAGVTPAARQRFWALIRQLADAGKTVFVTTHYMDEAEQCGRIALMRAGEIIALDSPAALKLATFPHGVYELTARAALRGELVTRLQQPQAGFAIQPYGRRYHALVRDPAAWRAAQSWIDTDFTVRAVSPSLEDVFIERVEGQGR
jgi:ABC-2 type transport system ATP-binding protein